MSTLIDYLNELDMQKTAAYEQDLLSYARRRLETVDRVKIVGDAPENEPLVSVQLEGLDVKKAEQFLSHEYNLTVRAGMLTAQPLMKVLKVPGLLRASFCYFNTKEEIDVYVEALQRFIKENG